MSNLFKVTLKGYHMSDKIVYVVSATGNDAIITAIKTMCANTNRDFDGVVAEYLCKEDEILNEEQL